MKKQILLVIIISLTALLGYSFLFLPIKTPANEIRLEQLASGFLAPLAMAASPDGTGRLFIVEQRGLVRVINKGELSVTPFIDLREKIVNLNFVYDERGLLGMTFHPQFKKNGLFYVYYSAVSSKKGSHHKSIVAEYKIMANDPNRADPASARILMQIEQPEMNHNGGCMAFGPDGYLYIALGDGGGGGDKHGLIGNAQNLTNLLGKILRINVNKGTPYSVPTDNPFAGSGLSTSKPEIWAYGLRNPWKFSFDRKTGQLFCADVGQNKWEEINIIEKGKNYGWRLMEGKHCFNPEKNCYREGLIFPIAEYDHSEGKSVTGGYVYRGEKYPQWIGKYLFADWTGALFCLTQQPDKSWKKSTLSIKGKPNDELYILSFGEDQEGELFILTSGGVGPGNKQGAVWKLILE